MGTLSTSALKGNDQQDQLYLQITCGFSPQRASDNMAKKYQHYKCTDELSSHAVIKNVTFTYAYNNIVDCTFVA